MGGLADVLKFETFNFKGMKKQIGHDPWRLLIGSGDRYSTSAWNKILGRHDDPIVDQFGGAASQRYGQAEQAGIDTTAGRNVHTVARVIALYNAGGAGANAAGGGGAAGAGGEGAAGAAPGGTALGGDLGYGGVTTGAPSLGGGTSVAIDSGVSAGGAGSVGSTGSAPASAGGSSSGLGNWQKLMGRFQQQGQQQADTPQHRAELYEQDPYLQSLVQGGSTLATSSKALKTRGGLADAAISRGMQLKNPVDANGVQILMIQQLTQQLAKAKTALDALERKRAKKG